MPDGLLRAAARGGSAVSAASQQRAQMLTGNGFPFTDIYGLGDLTRRAEAPPAPTPPPPPPRDPVPQSSTNGVTTTDRFNYPPELPALSAPVQAAMAQRRRAASSEFERFEDFNRLERQRAKGDAQRREAMLERDRQLESRAGMQTLAGRGVGRSPMFVNPFQRRLTEQTQRATAELQSGLASTLANLRAALDSARSQREREFAQIDFDTASARSDLARILGGY